MLRYDIHRQFQVDCLGSVENLSCGYHMSRLEEDANPITCDQRFLEIAQPPDLIL